MFNHIARHFAQTLVVVVGLSFFCYFLMGLMPGDPVDMMVASNPQMTSEDVIRLKHLYGLDQPLTTRYAHWAKSILNGDLGYSRTYRVPVAEILGPRLLNTFILSMLALVISLCVAIPLGVYSATKSGETLDHVLSLFSFAGIAVPTFWLSIVLIIVFSVKLNMFPAGGTSTVGVETQGLIAVIIDRLRYLALPALALSIVSTGRFVRFVRSAMIESLHNDYIRTAKAKGLSRQQIIWQHGFRNALIPLITVVSLSFSSVFSGALITETVFSYQGAGKLVYDSIIGNDYNVAMVSFLISVSMVLIMNLIADVLYAKADPRIRFN